MTPKEIIDESRREINDHGEPTRIRPPLPRHGGRPCGDPSRGRAEGDGEVRSPSARTVVPGMGEYRSILGHTDGMQVLGNPRTWALVSQGHHPFAPERVVLLPSGDRIGYGDRCGGGVRRKIDGRLRLKWGHMEGYDRRGFPDSKRESIYWIMETMVGHYDVRPQFEDWVVGLAGREILGSTAFCGMGLAHEFQRGGDAPVDSPPVDWWLFLFPGGIDWAAIDGRRVFAVVAHVAQRDPALRCFSDMYPIWGLTQRLWGTVPDWGRVARMGRVGASHHLNTIVARCLEDNAP